MLTSAAVLAVLAARRARRGNAVLLGVGAVVLLATLALLWNSAPDVVLRFAGRPPVTVPLTDAAAGPLALAVEGRCDERTMVGAERGADGIVRPAALVCTSDLPPGGAGGGTAPVVYAFAARGARSTTSRSSNSQAAADGAASAWAFELAAADMGMEVHAFDATVTAKDAARHYRMTFHAWPTAAVAADADADAQPDVTRRAPLRQLMRDLRHARVDVVRADLPWRELQLLLDGVLPGSVGQLSVPVRLEQEAASQADQVAFFKALHAAGFRVLAREEDRHPPWYSHVPTVTDPVSCCHLVTWRWVGPDADANAAT